MRAKVISERISLLNSPLHLLRHEFTLAGAREAASLQRHSLGRSLCEEQAVQLRTCPQEEAPTPARARQGVAKVFRGAPANAAAAAAGKVPVADRQRGGGRPAGPAAPAGGGQ